jgi:SOS response regulatory protein OraA/RecX
VTGSEPEPLELAAAALARRDLTPAALAAKLQARGVSADAAAEAVARLQAAGYVDETRFAVARAEALAERGWGDAGIRHDLALQGCSLDEADAAVAGLEPEAQRARAIVAAAGVTARTLRRLAAKGFSADVLGDLTPAD